MRNYRNQQREAYPAVIAREPVRFDPIVSRAAWARTVVDAQVASAEIQLRECRADRERYFELWQSAMTWQPPGVGKDVSAS